MNTARFRSVTRLLGVTLVLAGAAALAQDDPFIGAWVLNTAKSAGGGRITMTYVVSDAGGGQLKSVSDTTMGAFTIHSESTFALDGQDYIPVSTPPTPAGVTASSERVSDRVYKTSVKRNGQVFVTQLHEVSEDGGTLTVTVIEEGPDAAPNTVHVLDRQ